MSRRIPKRRQPHVTKAKRQLAALLRSPKTRDGLIAAVCNEHISKHFVYGYLSDGLREGTITCHKSGRVEQFQAVSGFVAEKPAEGLYPEWLEPRSLPTARTRQTFFAGKAASCAPEEDEEE